MGRKILALVILGLFVTVAGGVAYAALFGNSTPAATPKTTPAAKMPPKVIPQDIPALQAKTVTTLNAQRWSVTLLPLKTTPASKAQQPDILTFVGNTIFSQFLTDKGYAPSNYAVNVQADGSSVLEALQRKDNDDIATLRLTLGGNTLMGTIMVRPKAGNVEGYYFNGASALPVAPPPQVAVAAKPAPAPTTAPKATLASGQKTETAPQKK